MSSALNKPDLDLPFEFKEPKRRLSNLQRAVLVLAGVCAVLWLMPFYYLAVSMFKSTEEYARSNPLGLPKGLAPVVDNVREAWVAADMPQAFANTALYAIVGSGVAVFFAAMAAYALSRLDFRGRGTWFMLIFLGTIFPFQMYLIPLFFGYQRLGILNTHFGMLLFYSAICIPFPTLVLKNYMSQISRDIDESARMEGASELRIFWSIVLPNCIGPLIALFLLQFTWVWNDLLFSMVLGNRPEVRSIMNALQVFQGNYTTTGPNVALTASLLASLPPLVAFFFLRKHFMEGLKI